MKKRFEKGQTILELLVAISILVIVIGALASLGLGTLKDSTISRNRSTADFLAQQALEQVRNVREQNGWEAFYNYSVTVNNCYDQVDSIVWELKPKGGIICSAVSGENISIDNVSYNRFIKLDDSTVLPSPTSPTPDCPTNCEGRLITVTISWDDSGGKRSIQQSSLLTERLGL
jgi:type II secretory pathway pseudopilin PulG